MNVRMLVEQAVANYADAPPAPFSEDMPEEQSYLATPDRLAYALGWVVADAIVNARFADSAIDVLPVYHPEHGWDRFLISRRVSSKTFEKESANRYGMIMLSGDDAPRLTTPGGETKLALGRLLRREPEKAIARVLEQFPRGRLLPLDLGARWKDRQRMYPVLYDVVTRIIVAHPGVVAAREIFVDTQQVDGAFHPLHLHAPSKFPRLVYDWFLVQHADEAAFFRVHGGAAVYHTDRSTWSTVRKQLSDEPTPEAMIQRVLGWLRIEGAPDDAVD